MELTLEIDVFASFLSKSFFVDVLLDEVIVLDHVLVSLLREDFNQLLGS